MLYKLLFFFTDIPPERQEAVKAEIRSTPASYKWAFLGLLVGPFLAIDGLARVEAPPWTMILVTAVQIAAAYALVLTNLKRKGIRY